MKKVKIGMIVEVEWRDSNLTHGWRDENLIQLDRLANCSHWGKLKVMDSDKITLAFGESDFGSVSETIDIPHGSIKSIRELK